MELLYRVIVLFCVVFVLIVIGDGLIKSLFGHTTLKRFVKSLERFNSRRNYVLSVAEDAGPKSQRLLINTELKMIQTKASEILPFIYSLLDHPTKLLDPDEVICLLAEIVVLQMTADRYHTLGKLQLPQKEVARLTHRFILIRSETDSVFDIVQHIYESEDICREPESNVLFVADAVQ